MAFHFNTQEENTEQNAPVILVCGAIANTLTDGSLSAENPSIFLNIASQNSANSPEASLPQSITLVVENSTWDQTASDGILYLSDRDGDNLFNSLSTPNISAVISESSLNFLAFNRENPFATHQWNNVYRNLNDVSAIITNSTISTTIPNTPAFWSADSYAISLNHSTVTDTLGSGNGTLKLSVQAGITPFIEITGGTYGSADSAADRFNQANSKNLFAASEKATGHGTITWTGLEEFRYFSQNNSTTVTENPDGSLIIENGVFYNPDAEANHQWIYGGTATVSGYTQEKFKVIITGTEETYIHTLDTAFQEISIDATASLRIGNTLTSKQNITIHVDKLTAEPWLSKKLIETTGDASLPTVTILNNKQETDLFFAKAIGNNLYLFKRDINIHFHSEETEVLDMGSSLTPEQNILIHIDAPDFKTPLFRRKILTASSLSPEVKISIQNNGEENDEYFTEIIGNSLYLSKKNVICSSSFSQYEPGTHLIANGLVYTVGTNAFSSYGDAQKAAGSGQTVIVMDAFVSYANQPVISNHFFPNFGKRSADYLSGGTYTAVLDVNGNTETTAVLHYDLESYRTYEKARTAAQNTGTAVIVQDLHVKHTLREGGKCYNLLSEDGQAVVFSHCTVSCAHQDNGFITGEYAGTLTLTNHSYFSNLEASSFNSLYKINKTHHLIVSGQSTVGSLYTGYVTSQKEDGSTRGYGPNGWEDGVNASTVCMNVTEGSLVENLFCGERNAEVDADIFVTLDRGTVSNLHLSGEEIEGNTHGHISITLKNDSYINTLTGKTPEITLDEYHALSLHVTEGISTINSFSDLDDVFNPSLEICKGATLKYAGTTLSPFESFANNGTLCLTSEKYTGISGTEAVILAESLIGKGAGRITVDSENVAVCTFDGSTYAMAKQDSITVNAEWEGKDALSSFTVGDATYVYGVNAFAHAEDAAGLLTESGTIHITGTSVTIDEPSLTGDFSLTGEGAGKTDVTTSGNLYANGNALSLSNLTWNGILYGGNENAATGDTSVQVQNCTLKSGIYGGSRIDGGTVSTGDIFLALSSVTMASGKVISGAGYVLDNSDVTIGNVSVELADIGQSGTKAASFYAAGAIKGGNAHVSVTGAVTTEITDSIFVNVFNGINLNGGTASSYSSRENLLSITGGTYTGMVGNGSAVKSGSETIQGASSLILNGGLFQNLVYAGAFSDGGSAKVEGDTSLTILGGTFQEAIYAGNGASTINNGINTALYGDTNLIIDASANAIHLEKSLYGGSMGTGRVYGNSTLTIKGIGSNLSFGDDAHITGDSGKATKSGDLLYQDGRWSHGDTPENPKHFVSGTRTLVFDDFSGSFGANIYGSIDTLRILNSNVEMAGKQLLRNNLSNVTVWEFDLTGSDRECAIFAFNRSDASGNYFNDFSHDSLSVTFDTETLEDGPWTLFDGSDNTIIGWDGFDSVVLNGTTATFSKISNSYTAGDCKFYRDGDDLKLAKIAGISR